MVMVPAIMQDLRQFGSQEFSQRKQPVPIYMWECRRIKSQQLISDRAHRLLHWSLDAKKAA
jgi:hypothetical protein